MEYWDIYDADKKRTGRLMKRNDWCLKDGEYHLSVLGVVMRPDGRFLITKRVMTKAWAPGWWEVSGGAAHNLWQCIVLLFNLPELEILLQKNSMAITLLSY